MSDILETEKLNDTVSNYAFNNSLLKRWMKPIETKKLLIGLYEGNSSCRWGLGGLIQERGGSDNDRINLTFKKVKNVNLRYCIKCVQSSL